MTNDPRGPQFAREYYTAQEIADLALEWGASATLLDNGGEMSIELERERTASSVQLELGPVAEFYDDMICRNWLFVPSAPHRFCDRWNRFPYFATLSVVYDENDIPKTTEFGFVIRAAKLLEFEKFRKRDDIFLEVLMFWFAMEVVQESVQRGVDDVEVLREGFRDGSFTTWWFGDDFDAASGDSSDE